MEMADQTTRRSLGLQRQLKKKFPFTDDGDDEPIISLPGKVMKATWNDTEILQEPGFAMANSLTSHEMDIECSIFLYSISETMTSRGAASALILTWNMFTQYPYYERMFPLQYPSPLSNDSGTDLSQLGNGIDVEKIGEQKISWFRRFCRNDDEFRRQISFLAASTLRLFTKSPASWNTAWSSGHLRDKYFHFHKIRFCFDGLVPNAECIERLGFSYKQRSFYKGVLGRILYSIADVNTKSREILDILFVRHLEFTGMHIVPQFIEAKNGLGASTTDLFMALYTERHRSTLKTLHKVVKEHLVFDISAEHRGTWKFSRLFNSDAFSALQSKHCAQLLFVLANINLKVSKSKGLSGSNPLNISAISSIGDFIKPYLEKVADNIYSSFVALAEEENNSDNDLANSKMSNLFI